MNEAFITPGNLAWARTRAGLSAEELAAKQHVPAEKLLGWERGEARPSLRQAEALATHLHVPVGYLFLSTPPVESPAIPDFRSGYAGRGKGLSLELRDVIDEAQRRQDAYRDIIEEDGAELLPFIARFDARGDPAEIAADMRVTLGIGEDFPRHSRDWRDHLGRLARAAEDAGILVFRSGIVGSNSHRRLSTEEFRGFVLSDDLAPIIFINAADYKAAQIFTFAHELAHLWLGESGISNQGVDGFTRDADAAVERLCDKAAAEFLVPVDSFIDNWKRDADPVAELQRLARFYRVSAIVILRRAYELGLVGKGQFISLLEEARGFRSEHDERSEEGGGDFYATLGVRNGERFTSVILGALRGGRLLYREAALLLDVHPSTLGSLEVRRAGQVS
jgi:Zn-dependent peptidase ImmA (M78 family)/DNA-binding XRE family transcriptional regulator